MDDGHCGVDHHGGKCSFGQVVFCRVEKEKTEERVMEEASKAAIRAAEVEDADTVILS